jgi:hypothetical protein
MTKEQIELVEKLNSDGIPYKKIGEILKIGRYTISRYFVKKGIFKNDSKSFVKDGTEVNCKSCGRRYVKDRKKGHKGKQCNSCSTRKKELVYKNIVANIIGLQCCKCGYDKCEEAIEYHHVKDKSFTISSSFQYISIKELEIEAKKCIPFCANCHREYHYEKFDYNDININNLKEYQKELLLTLLGGGNEH